LGKAVIIFPGRDGLQRSIEIPTPVQNKKYKAGQPSRLEPIFNYVVDSKEKLTNYRVDVGRLSMKPLRQTQRHLSLP
jgi:hypothetical protein